MIRWELVSQSGCAGFHILRASAGKPPVRVTSEMIANDGGEYPRSFSWVDADVAPDVEYTYQIQVIHPDGTAEAWDTAVVARVTTPGGPALQVVGASVISPRNGGEFAFDIPRPGGLVSITLCDASGRRVSTLVDGFMAAGTHACRLAESDLSRLETGVYFLTMEAGTFKDSKRVVLVK